MTIGEHITCQIEKLVSGGYGLARHDGCVIFVSGVIDGENVTARIDRVQKHFAYATCTQIHQASAFRTQSLDVTTQPGCDYHIMTYEHEVMIKQQQLLDALTHTLRHTSAPVPHLKQPVTSPLATHYRNKIVLHVQCENGTWIMGYREEQTHHVVDTTTCLLACSEINEALPAIRAAVLAEPNTCDVTIRYTATEGVIWWRSDRPRPATPLTEQLDFGTIHVPSDGFFQVNPAVAQQLVQTVTCHATDEILDLYCGVGVFGLACMHAGCTRLHGIESGRTAVATARANADALGIRATFSCAQLGHKAVRFPISATTTVIVDPPRDGMHPVVAKALASSPARRIIYVSCNPATLMRDVARITAQGAFSVTHVQLFDMFPRTPHFETCLILEKVS